MTIRKGKFLNFLFLTIFYMVLLVAGSFPLLTKASSQPDVTTENESNVTDTSATLNGSVDGNGLSTRAWFEYGTTRSMNDSTSESSYGSNGTDFHKNISGLDSDTTYYFRAVAENNDGTEYGDIFSFRTDFFDHNNDNNHSEPYITTNNATSIGNGGATLNGFVDGNGLSTRAWFEYGTDTNLNRSTSKTSYSSNSNGSNFHKDISGLDSNTIYYFRAVADNSEGTVYGDIFSFRTNGNGYYSNTNYYNQTYYPNYYDQNYYGENISGSNPTALTQGATSVSNTGAQLNAVIFNPMGSPANAWFEWGTTAALGYNTGPISVGTLPQVNHVNSLTGLSPGTTYYFRAVAENSYWRNNGSISSFTTSGAPIAQSTNTIIIREVVPTTTTVTVPAQNTPAPTSDSTSSSYLGANLLGSGGFLPQNLFGWIVLIVLFLILLLLVKNIYKPNSNQSHH